MSFSVLIYNRIMLCFCCDMFCLISYQPLDFTYNLGICCFLFSNVQILFNCVNVNSVLVYSSRAVASDDEGVCQGYTVRIYEYYAVSCTIEDCYIC
jgi:hypothetical protein